MIRALLSPANEHEAMELIVSKFAGLEEDEPVIGAIGMVVDSRVYETTVMVLISGVVRVEFGDLARRFKISCFTTKWEL